MVLHDEHEITPLFSDEEVEEEVPQYDEMYLHEYDELDEQVRLILYHEYLLLMLEDEGVHR